MANAFTGNTIGVSGVAMFSPDGIGVKAQGASIGVRASAGPSSAFQPIGLDASAGGDISIGVRAVATGANSNAGVFISSGAGNILSLRSGPVGSATERVVVDGAGNTTISGTLDVAGNITGGGEHFGFYRIVFVVRQ